MTIEAQLRSSPSVVRMLLEPRLATVVCGAVGVLSALPAAYDVWKVATLALAQIGAPAQPTDFLNLYSGADLMLHAAVLTYSLDAQLIDQQALSGSANLLVPFFLPPHAALLLSWLGLLPYGVAYLVWLAIGCLSVVLAAHLLAPHWTRWSPLIWFGLAMLYLPGLLGLAQGQTSALMLLAFAAFARAVLDDGKKRFVWLATLGVLGWTLKPQLAWVLFAALLFSRRWLTVGSIAAVVAAFTAVAVARLTPDGFAAYVSDSRSKLVEALSADPTWLPGPTLLHASLWFLGVTPLAYLVAALLIGGAGAGFVYLWRDGLAQGQARPLQVASLPIVAIISAPYALVYELTPWLATFWLLWRFTSERPAARAILLWLSSGVWIAADVGVMQPLNGGADTAALFGLAVVGYIVYLFHTSSPSEIAKLPAAGDDRYVRPRKAAPRSE